MSIPVVLAEFIITEINIFYFSATFLFLGDEP